MNCAICGARRSERWIRHVPHRSGMTPSHACSPECKEAAEIVDAPWPGRCATTGLTASELARRAKSAPGASFPAMAAAVALSRAYATSVGTQGGEGAVSRLATLVGRKPPEEASREICREFDIRGLCDLDYIANIVASARERF